MTECPNARRRSSIGPSALHPHSTRHRRSCARQNPTALRARARRVRVRVRVTRARIGFRDRNKHAIFGQPPFNIYPRGPIPSRPYTRLTVPSHPSQTLFDVCGRDPRVNGCGFSYSARVPPSWVFQFIKR